MSFAALVRAALDAAGHDDRSPVGAWALDRVPDVGAVVSRHGLYVRTYGMRHAPRRIDPQDAALHLVLTAEREAGRGVRCVS